VEAGPLTVKKLFQKDVRYLVPTFQRPYVWNQDDQWEPLWDDVRNSAELYQEQLDTHGDAAAAEEATGAHFLGAVVLQQRMMPVKDLEVREVIDGQQRMTTIQLLLDACQETFERLELDSNARRLARLVQNAYVDGDEVFKLWPTSMDQDAFRAAMTNDAPTDGFAASPIVKAHEFFQLQIEEWLNAVVDLDDRQARADALETALSGLLEMVVIDLGARDDAFAIFETLNARGTPLLASDLVKNFVLQTAAAAGINADVLHRDVWSQIEADWWRADSRQGRLVRPRVDQFLNYWLTLRTVSDVQSHEVFRVFKDHVEASDQPVDAVAVDVVTVAGAFKALHTATEPPDRERFVYRWKTMEAGVATPILLALFSQPLPSDEVQRATDVIESYLLRRMAARMTTKDYNRLFLEALEQLERRSPGTTADAALSNYLASQTSESRIWPTDEEFTAALVELPLYKLLTRPRMRLILEALENDLRTKFACEPNCPRGLTIEHVMPQGWREHWAPPLGPDPTAAAIERDRLIHTVGNLTLVNDRLNPRLSNSTWDIKQAELAKHSTLFLNKTLVEGYGDSDITDASIKERSHALAVRACAIWPRPR
jgi:hypothetical protein